MPSKHQPPKHAANAKNIVPVSQNAPTSAPAKPIQTPAASNVWEKRKEEQRLSMEREMQQQQQVQQQRQRGGRGKQQQNRFF